MITGWRKVLRDCHSHASSIADRAEFRLQLAPRLPIYEARIISRTECIVATSRKIPVSSRKQGRKGVLVIDFDALIIKFDG
ncbi:hypothetical protein BwSG20_77780 [Bradyrhizobium ottawaense]|nr:hypothetical protein BwSG20_77780 [Bradyrhizobium ottawaense]